MSIQIRELMESDLTEIVSAFAAIKWDKPLSQFQKYLSEQDNGGRSVLVAFEDQQFVGYVTIVWQSEYPAFREEHIPEIVDLNVLPAWQRRGIGSQLMDRAEKLVSERSSWVGIGVGLAPGYNAAQKMYVGRGYIPDGLGITYDNQYPAFGETVAVDHGLELHLKKNLSSAHRKRLKNWQEEN